MIQNVFFDMDGTILDEVGKYDSRLVELINTYKSVNFGVITNRDENFASKYMLELNLNNHNILEDGSYIKKGRDEIILADNTIDFEEIINKVERLSQSTIYQINQNKRYIISVHYKCLEDGLMYKCPKTTRQMEKVLIKNLNNDKILIYDTGRSNIILKDKGVSKKEALKYLCLKGIIAPQDTLVIGDGINDIDMFDFTSNCYAVNNAIPELKKKAKYVASQKYSLGVIEILENELK